MLWESYLQWIYHAPVYDNQGNEVNNEKCAFCRTISPTSKEENIKRIMKRVEAGDPMAIYNRGNYYRDGLYGPQDYSKAFELWHHAGELGHAMAYCNIGYCYVSGQGVEVDKNKAVHYSELGAMAGDVSGTI